MKKIFLVMMLSLMTLPVWAKFTNIDIPPECLIDGSTRTKPYHGNSDTSGWSMLKTYDGECEQVPELTSLEKEKLYTKLLAYFKKKNYTQTYENYSWGVQGIAIVEMNQEWRKFVDTLYFPLLKKLILSETRKEAPNTQKISMYNYAASIIGYDYKLIP